jgi:hypothetical protein
LIVRSVGKLDEHDVRVASRAVEDDVRAVAADVERRVLGVERSPSTFYVLRSLDANPGHLIGDARENGDGRGQVGLCA